MFTEHFHLKEAFKRRSAFSPNSAFQSRTNLETNNERKLFRDEQIICSKSTFVFQCDTPEPLVGFPSPGEV